MPAGAPSALAAIAQPTDVVPVRPPVASASRQIRGRSRVASQRSHKTPRRVQRLFDILGRITSHADARARRHVGPSGGAADDPPLKISRVRGKDSRLSHGRCMCSTPEQRAERHGVGLPTTRQSTGTALAWTRIHHLALSCRQSGGCEWGHQHERVRPGSPGRPTRGSRVPRLWRTDTLEPPPQRADGSIGSHTHAVRSDDPASRWLQGGPAGTEPSLCRRGDG